ncbi:LysR family transcriptional regulator [Caballeronia ptereochthonis]|uniref:LysR family transcriptional regulator n=1 Tax=Caballeronia ptereochthonis TaxID=1777144 RepID=A0A158DNM9_9BURK|nr:LysR family transcriptional regulator [Caballeronia ptereochthonis]SAK96020.1 LysR family transcriptional regulator [Caballeronia ptereochthonis]
MNLIESMRIYVRVVERASISDAARDLGIGQPTVSERIERLEKFVGCRLLLRSARAFKCTPEGQTFYERSKTILLAASEAISEISGDRQLTNGTTRIAAPHCFGEIVLPHLIQYLRTNFPPIGMSLTLNDKVVDLVTEGVDISFRIGNLGEGAFIAYPLGKVKRCLVASRAYLDGHRPIAAPSDLTAHSFIGVNGAFATDQITLIGEAGIVESVPVRSEVTTSHWRPAYEMIRMGMGIGVLEEYACAEALATGQFAELLADFRIPALDLNLLTQAQRPIPQRVRTIVSILRNAVPNFLSGNSQSRETTGCEPNGQ